MRTFPVFFMLAVLSLPAQAQVYKWTDADGKVDYSDRAVGNGEPIRIRKLPDADPEAGTKLQQFRNQLEGSRQIQDEKAEEAQQQAAQQQARCVHTRNLLQDFEKFGQIYQMQDGERVYLDHQQKDAHMAEMRQFLRENCN